MIQIEYAQQTPLTCQAGFAQLCEARRIVELLREIGIEARVMERTRVNGSVTLLIALAFTDARRSQ